MNQIKIGMFIAELRKEQGMTQKQLAEHIGVSDKTVSKWECGNGLPEMSSIPVLCEALGINMNELLSGERLAEEVYSVKAEENMMTLMKETEVHKKKNKTSLITFVVCFVGILLTMMLAVSFGIDFPKLNVFLDLPTLIMIVVPVLLILAATGLIKPFFKAFIMLGKRVQHSEQQLIISLRALKVGMISAVTVGGLETLATIILLLGFYQKSMAMEVLFANIAIAILAILYGGVICLLLLLIYFKLKEEQSK